MLNMAVYIVTTELWKVNLYKIYIYIYEAFQVRIKFLTVYILP
jgi:hypothetical protein